MGVIHFEKLACTGNARIIAASLGPEARLYKVVSLPEEPDPAFSGDEELEHVFVLYRGIVHNDDGIAITPEELLSVGIDVTEEIMSLPWEMLG